MKKIFPLKLLVLIGFIQNSNAAHILGADIYYKWVGEKRFEISFRIYRDCSSINLTTPDMFVRSADNAISHALDVKRVSIKDVSLHCDSVSAPCFPSNTPTTFGVEEHIFIDTVDFASGPFNEFIIGGYCEVLISVDQCCRSSNITSLEPGQFYNEAMLNVCEIGTFKNSSPIFQTLPLESVCVNKYTNYSLAAWEPDDKDSLSFELVAPKVAVDADATYKSPFSVNNPISTYNTYGFKFDNVNGSLQILPINASQVGVIVMQVNEWRRDSLGEMKRIGYVRREMELIVSNCSSNNSPYFSGVNAIAICEGSQFCANFGANDDSFLPNQIDADTVELTNINPIPSAVFIIVDSLSRQKQGKFCWTTKIGDARNEPYRTTFKAFDNNCSNPSVAYKDFLIRVRPIAKFSRHYDWGFRGVLYSEVIPIGLGAEPIYQMTVYDSAMVPLYVGSKMKDSFRFYYIGKFYVEHKLTGKGINCPGIKIDTLDVTLEMLTSIDSKPFEWVKILPNPSQGVFKLIGAEGHDINSVQIFTIDGKSLGAAVLRDNTLDMSEYPAGNYVLLIESANIQTRKLVVIGR